MTRPTPTTLVRAATLAVLVLSLVSCGGGSHGGGIGGTGIVFGVISGFGSVIVNDVEFDTTTAIITRDGEPATEAELGLGMIARVVGPLDVDGLTGTADTIQITTLLEGPLERVATDFTSATVLGGTIVFDANTVVDSLTMDPSAVGTTVEVSGFIDANGNIRATRIAGKSTPVDFGFAVSGVLENVDLGAQTFVIRGVTIDYAAAELIDPPTTGINDGLEVRVVVVAPPSAGMAEAASVRFFSRSLSEQADRIVKTEGIVTAQLTPRRFVLGGRRVFRITDSTTIIGGTRADIVPDLSLAIVGALDDSGIIRAERLELRGVVDAAPTFPAAVQEPDRPYYRSF